MPTFDGIIRCLPVKCSRAINDFISSVSDGKAGITDIHLRAGRPMSVTYKNTNITLFSGKNVICDENDLNISLRILCEDAVYVYSESIKEGFLTLSGGYRVGICGRAVCTENRISRICDITSLSVRIPHSIPGVGDGIYGIIRRDNMIEGALIYSPPGVGKTTLIRALCVKLSSGAYPLRVCVIDTRSEIICEDSDKNGTLDVLRGYPKGKGIEIATRTLSPQVIVCDEIGSSEEASAILEAQNSGVPLIATAHAGDYASLVKRPNIAVLKNAGIFTHYIGIKRTCDGREYDYTVQSAEEVLR